MSPNNKKKQSPKPLKNQQKHKVTPGDNHR